MADQVSDGDGGHPGGSGQTVRSLDHVDRRILAELVRDGRMSIRALAERVHVSRANAYARVERLRRDRVITGFAALIEPERAGLGTSAFVLLTIQQNAWREVSSVLLTVPYVEHIALVGGDFDVLVRVRAPDNAALRHLVLERIQDVPGVQATRTWLVFDEAHGVGAGWDEGVGHTPARH